MKRLEGKVAIITGGARGLGKSTAKLFKEHGAHVYIWDIVSDGAEVAAELGVKFHEVNTTQYDKVEAAAKEIQSEHGRIDVLVNNAGITRDSSLLKMTHEQWQQVMDVNLTAVFNCTRAIAPFMKEKGYGRIITASSVVGLYGNFGQTNYVATKSGVIGMTKVWGRELGRYGITANCVAPGFIASDMTAKMPEDVLKGVVDKIPVKRIGQPEDIAHAYLFLASDEAGFVNGTCLSVDGGYVA